MVCSQVNGGDGRGLTFSLPNFLETRASSVACRNRVVAFFPAFPPAGNLLRLPVPPPTSLLIPPGVTAEYFLTQNSLLVDQGTLV